MDAPPPRQHTLRLDLVVAACLFVLAVSLRMYNVDKVLVFGDETYFQAYIFEIIGNNWLWPVRFMQLHPPLFPYLGAVSAVLFAGTWGAFRQISSIMGGLAVVVIYLLGKEMFSRTTGFMAALLLAFAPFFILVGKYAIIDATLSPLIYLSVYAFWKGYVKRDGLKYMVLAGLFLGIANDTKYTAFLLYPTFAVFIIWYTKSFRSLLDKKVLLAFLASAAAFSPIVLALQMNGSLLAPIDHLMAQKAKGTIGLYKPLPLDATIVLGLDQYVNTITGYPSVETLSLPWFSIFEAAIYILAPLAVIYSLTRLFRKKPADAFLGILFVIFNGFIMVALGHNQTYFTWSLPAFFLILSSFAAWLFQKLRPTLSATRDASNAAFSALTPLKLGGLVLVGIVIVSTATAGLAAPVVDRGGYGFGLNTTGFYDSAEFIKKRASMRDVVAMDPPAYINFSSLLFGPVRPAVLFNQTATEIKGHYYMVKVFNIDLVEEIKPRFMLIYSNSYSQLSETDRRTILESYRLAFLSGDWRVFERTAMPEETAAPTRGVSGTFILKDISLASIPPIVTVGEPYVIDLWVINQGNQTSSFKVGVDAEYLFVLRYDDAVTLPPNGLWHLNITVVPEVPDAHDTIRIKLFLAAGSSPTDMQLQDAITKDVRLTASLLSEVFWIVAPFLLILVAAGAVVRRRRTFRRSGRRLLMGKSTTR